MPESPNRQETVLAEGTEFEGAIRSKCPISVSGNLLGDVSAPTLVVTRTGSVHGRIKVAEVKSEGEIAGEIVDEAECVAESGAASAAERRVDSRRRQNLGHRNGGLQIAERRAATGDAGGRGLCRAGGGETEQRGAGE